MPLVLAPSFDDHTREEIEAHLEEVRTRRMVMAIEYNEGKTTKLQHESNKVQNQVARAYELLGKAIQKLDSDLDKAEQYLVKCQTLSSELGLVNSMIELEKSV